MQDLNGKVAVITGGASGIGRATALALARAGTRLVLADIDEEGAEAVAREIEAGHGHAIGTRCDVSAETSFGELADAALRQFGRIDIVMNNVGVLTSGRPDELPIAEWQRIIDINLMSVVRSNHVFLPLLMQQGSGHIVNTASFAGLYTYAYDRLPYAATKAAIIQISEGLALYLRPKGIGVTCLCPGPVKTNIMRSLRSFSTGLEVRGPGAQFALLEAAAVGNMVVEAIRRNTLLLVTDEQVREILVRRARDPEAVLEEQIRTPHIIVAARQDPP
jgi:NAD(P)-dependent dehydrogenase (short-subunit alcohol dehydrogenase family)